MENVIAGAAAVAAIPSFPIFLPAARMVADDDRVIVTRDVAHRDID
ncbi:hypothetical protein [Pseudomonas sp.]